MPDPVSLSHDGDVAIVTLDDKPRRNALGLETIATLTAAIAGLGDARAVILRAGAGCTVWCAGFDIDALAPGHDPLAPDGPLQGLFRAVEACPAPVIAMLNGSAWGGGADLALRCDMAVGDGNTTIAFTPARLGLPYDPDGLLNVLRRAGLGAAMEMFATAEPFGAERLLRLGLLNHVVPADELAPFTLALARRIAANAPLSVRSAKRQLRALAAAMPLPEAALRPLLDERAAALASADFAEGLAAFRGKRKAVFRGS